MKIFEIDINEIDDLIIRDYAIQQADLDLAQLFVQRNKYRKEGTVSYVDVVGPLLRKASSFEEKTGITSYQMLLDELDMAEADDTDSLVLNIDSPGGEALGTDAVVQRIINFSKPVYAVVDSSSAGSAAYKIASAATYILASKDSMIGSIGSILVIDSTKPLMDSMGITRNIFVNKDAKTYKSIGHNFGELNEEQKTYLQELVEHSGKDFQDTVKSNRPQVSEQAFSGKMFRAEEALSLGLIDFIL